MIQPTLFEDSLYDINEWKVSCFSADAFYSQIERTRIETKFIQLTEVTDKFNRQSVSYQLSKNDSMHRWLKYKEGFSSELVNLLLDEFNINTGDTVLDPFLGSGTTSLVSKLRGINSVGCDILPMTEVAINVKKSVFKYDVTMLKKILETFSTINIPSNIRDKPSYISITRDAYPSKTESELCFFSKWNNDSEYPKEVKDLITLCILNSLERISFTAKDGQYLRWDRRSSKIIEAETKRKLAGKKPFTTVLDKGELPSLRETLLKELSNVIVDIELIQHDVNNVLFDNASLQVINGSALWELPTLKEESINGVITSPPYCNRYDYTRTYALELVYLGKNEDQVKELRQELLSCTVENKSKKERLKEHYMELGRLTDYETIISILNKNKTLSEINNALIARQQNRDINNKGVLKMVDGYFTELAFIYAELYRLCKPNSYVAFVNDNVRYGGEVIPVDFLSTEIAEQIGFIPIKIYTLKQQKGNSSQQMKKYGRIPLRKSITIWKRP